jgi:hypothetical protein
MLARTFARIDKLAWDMRARTVDVTITSVRKQDVTLIARYGIEAITAAAGVLWSLSAGPPGELQSRLFITDEQSLVFLDPPTGKARTLIPSSSARFSPLIIVTIDPGPCLEIWIIEGRKQTERKA